MLFILFFLGILYIYSIFFEEFGVFSSIISLTSALYLCYVVRYYKFAFKRAGVDIWSYIFGYFTILWAFDYLFRDRLGHWTLYKTVFYVSILFSLLVTPSLLCWIHFCLWKGVFDSTLKWSFQAVFFPMVLLLLSLLRCLLLHYLFFIWIEFLPFSI